MKFIVIALVCVVAYAAAQPVEFYEQEQSRVRREANPQGSITIQGTKPLGGPDRRPSLDVDYQHRIFNGDRTNANAYGGVNIRPGQPAQPHLGIQAERTYGNGHLHGFGQVQRGPGGRLEPMIGIGGQWRFRRDVDEVADQEEEH